MTIDSFVCVEDFDEANNCARERLFRVNCGIADEHAFYLFCTSRKHILIMPVDFKRKVY